MNAKANSEATSLKAAKEGLEKDLRILHITFGAGE